MKQLRWQILVVLVTLVIVAVLLFSTQSPEVGNVIQSQPERGSGRLIGPPEPAPRLEQPSRPGH
jgi:preprotein translocase subunit SecG